MIASLFACNKAEQYFVLGTFLEVKASGLKSSNAPSDVYQFMLSLETILSPTLDGSDIHNVNHADVGQEIYCSNHTMAIARKAQEIYALTNGAYDPSIYPIVRFYNLSGDLYVPHNSSKDFDLSEIPALLNLVGLDRAFRFDYKKGTITKLIDGAMLDFGSIAKGYAVDKAKELYDGKMLINLGGNISSNNDTYTIGIANPYREDRAPFDTAYFGKVTLDAGECISTSGDYERYYIVNVDGENKVYHHIIDARTGLASESGIISCTVISKDGAIADALSTAMMILGYENGKNLIESMGAKALVIFEDYSYKTVGDFVLF